MFQAWRLKLREAGEMLRSGQLDEASRLLMQDDLRQYLPGRRLGTQLAAQLADRARQRAIEGEMSAAWRDLRQGARLAGEIEAVTSARHEVIAIGLGDIESRLAAGETAQAIALAESLERNDVHDESLRRLKEAARRLESAQHLARRGKFSLAESQIKSVGQLSPALPIIAERRDAYSRKTDEFRQLMETMHRVVAAEDWSQAVTVSERLLGIAPEFHLAQDVRRKAWAKVGARLDGARLDGFGPQVGESSGVESDGLVAGEDQDSPSSSGISVSELTPGRRFVLWVDGVGGFLVCLTDELMLGQATHRSQVDIPICADLSRRHAQICRRGDGYVIRPLQRTSINGQCISDTTLLTDGDEIELAGKVRLRFRQPHALSASARLDIESRHRLDPSVDGVLLMAESCVLGPKQQNHVVCQDWQGDVVLYRRDENLHCRAMDSIEIDGRLCDGVGHVGPNSRVSGTDFSMSLEELT